MNSIDKRFVQSLSMFSGKRPDLYKQKDQRFTGSLPDEYVKWIQRISETFHPTSPVSLSPKWTMSHVAMEYQNGKFWQIICPMSKADDTMLLDGFDLTRHLIYLEFCIQTSSPSSVKTKRLGPLGIDMWSQGCDLTTLHFPHQYVTWLPDPAI